MKVLTSICIIALLHVGLLSCNSESATEGQTSGNDSVTTMQQADLATSDCMRMDNREHYCKTDSCLDIIVLFHSLSEDKFNAMKGYYPDQAPTVYSADKIRRIIGDATCEQWIAKVSEKADTLEFTVEKEERKSVAYYSLALIKGILRDADTFRFFRAKKLNTHREDIIFSVKVRDVTKFYDLSESIP